MATGTVKWFDEIKGYGFIVPDGGGRDVFVHHTGIADRGFKSLAESAKVEFEVREGRKGLEAFNVVVVARPKGPAEPGKGGRGKPTEARPRQRGRLDRQRS